MQNSTLPDQPVEAKEKHPADGSDRWSVTGPAGKVCYDLLGNHLALRPAIGEPDSVMGVTLASTREYALLGEDDIVFGILRNLYHAEIEFAPDATSEDRCVACGHEAEHRWDRGCEARSMYGERCGCTHVAGGAR